MMQPRVSSSDNVKELAQARGSASQPRASPRLFLKIILPVLALAGGFSVFAMYFTRLQIGFPVAGTAFQPCVEDTGALEQWIRPPSDLMHSMSDEELLWRASWVPGVKRYPFKRVPKVAFMFLTRGPLPLSPLWERYFRGNEGRYSVYLHTHPSYKANFTLNSVFYRRQIPSKVSEWGQMSMCDAERRLLANALLDLSNERFILLSESCIPLSNFNITYQYLMKSKYSFIGVIDDPGPYGRGRYNPDMAPEVNLEQWRKGSQWFEVNRKLAVTIVKDTAYYQKFERFCRPHCYVDEHYFPTMLTIESPHLLANRSITWVDWSRGGAHPATFGRSDISEAFLKSIRDGQNCSYNDNHSPLCFLFARKFAPSSVEPLLELAPALLGFGLSGK
ncbi:glycosyltransferase BC10-like [Curcuma longa]|uniref:glycosyltransferase BC10-like n=1 Tax=Curcuma longa TaxID=136217 RepID=UPI003D9F4358